MTSTTENLEAIIHTASDAIVTADSNGDIAAWNPAAERLFGHTEAEAIGQSVTLIVPERFRKQHLAGLSRVAGGGRTSSASPLRCSVSARTAPSSPSNSRSPPG